MMEIVRVFHPDVVTAIEKNAAAADRIGRWGVTGYKCNGYCSALHTDEDACRGINICLERVALDGEYSFCEPSSGYYIKVDANTVW